MKHLWHAGKKSLAFETLNQFVTLQARVGSSYSTVSVNGRGQEGTQETADNDKLLARFVKEEYLRSCCVDSSTSAVIRTS